MPLKAVTSFQVEMTLEIMKRKSVFLKSVYFNILLKVEKTFKYRNAMSQKFLCLRVGKRYSYKKIAVQGIAKDVIFDSKYEQTEVPIFSFSTNIFGFQKSKYFLPFLTSFLHQIKARVYAQTVE